MPTERPTARELVEAVREFVETEVQPQLEGSVAFHTRVAVNVLKIVERELELGGDMDDARVRRLAELLGSEGELESLVEELSRGIRAGNYDIRTPGLAEHLRATVMDKLAVDNPRYESYRRAREAQSSA